MARRYYKKRNYESYGYNVEGILALIVLASFTYVITFIQKYWNIIFVIILLVAFVIILFKNRKKLNFSNHYLKKLKKQSELYSKIQLVNNKYNLDNLNDFIDYHNIRFRSEFDSCNIDDYLLMTIRDRYDNLVEYKKKYDFLKKEYELYLAEYEELKKYINEEESKKIKMSLKKYNKYQNIIYEENKIKRDYKFKVIVYINYSSKKGKVRNKKYKVYYPQDFMKIMDEYLTLKNTKKMYEISSRIERAKMSDSIRYDVLKRDNYKCCICGRSAKDGVNLEVDHIIPVSKGGKTVISNLQTLCDRCNRGKSNKL